MLKLNEKVQNFELLDEEGKTFKLYEQKKPLLLVFYPGDDTPVCTAQLCDYRDGIQEFRDLEIQVIGISKDSIVSHQNFKKKYNLPFPLLSDPDGKVADSFGCKTLLGTINRAVFLLNANQELLWYHKETLSMFHRTKKELIEIIQKFKKENKI
ncbi:MAG: peroxiredoxin [Leptonema sp. (in: bacteria)]